MNSSLPTYVLSEKKENKTIYDYFQSLFLDEWLIDVNYSLYFYECSPLFCTYTITEKTNFLAALTLLISLYGGLIFIFRSFTPFLVRIICKLNDNQRNSGIY